MLARQLIPCTTIRIISSPCHDGCRQLPTQRQVAVRSSADLFPVSLGREVKLLVLAQDSAFDLEQDKRNEDATVCHGNACQAARCTYRVLADAFRAQNNGIIAILGFCTMPYYLTAVHLQPLLSERRGEYQAKDTTTLTARLSTRYPSSPPPYLQYRHHKPRPPLVPALCHAQLLHEDRATARGLCDARGVPTAGNSIQGAHERRGTVVVAAECIRTLLPTADQMADHEGLMTRKRAAVLLTWIA